MARGYEVLDRYREIRVARLGKVVVKWRAECQGAFFICVVLVDML